MSRRTTTCVVRLFDVAKYPDITFKSTRVEKARRWLYNHRFVLMRGYQEIALPFSKRKVTRGATHLGVEAALTINRRDYGMTWDATLDTGGLVVGSDVTIRLNMKPSEITADSAVAGDNCNARKGENFYNKQVWD